MPEKCLSKSSFCINCKVVGLRLSLLLKFPKSLLRVFTMQAVLRTCLNISENSKERQTISTPRQPIPTAVFDEGTS